MRIEARDPRYTSQVKEVCVYPAIGERVPVIGCWSEVMMHFGLADKPIEISMEYQTFWLGGKQYPLTDHRLMCQVWKDGHEFSALITSGEGGFYDCKDHGMPFQDGECGYYTYADISRLPAQETSS